MGKVTSLKVALEKGVFVVIFRTEVSAHGFIYYQVRYDCMCPVGALYTSLVRSPGLLRLWYLATVFTSINPTTHFFL